MPGPSSLWTVREVEASLSKCLSKEGPGGYWQTTDYGHTRTGSSCIRDLYFPRSPKLIVKQMIMNSPRAATVLWRLVHGKGWSSRADRERQAGFTGGVRHVVSKVLQDTTQHPLGYIKSKVAVWNTYYYFYLNCNRQNNPKHQWQF